MLSEALMEFEESLSFVAPSNKLMLANLDLKVDLNRFADGGVESISEEMLLSKFANYDYENDRVNVCSTCGMLFGESKSECCALFVRCQKMGFLSELEKAYWVSFFSNPYKTMVTAPNYTMMVFLQTGVPFELVPDIWRKLVLVNQTNAGGIPDVSRQTFRNFQHSYNRDISAQINKDLTRTFPSVSFFLEKSTVDALLTILNVYANYDLELGYCQGLLFLVGTLYFQFRNQELTFHALCKIMECEPEVRGIFVPASMLNILDHWFNQFVNILCKIDPVLAGHLTSFCDCKVFLFQWWLLMLLIHTPGLCVNNRITDFCMMEGWKVGLFKISAGLLLRNKPILMSFAEGDEEVVYQHLLNESKWGNIVSSMTPFFGDLLLSWDDSLFEEITGAGVPPIVMRKSHKRTTSSVLDMLKNLSVTSSVGSALASASTMSVTSSDCFRSRGNRSTLSVFSTRTDRDSIYSDMASTTSFDTHTHIDYLKLPRKSSHDNLSDDIKLDVSADDLVLENQMLRFFLKKAYDQLTDESLRQEILEAVNL